MSKIVNSEALKTFCEQIFIKLGVSKEDAKITADNLVLADLRGIPSHGVARLKRYVDGIKTGVILPKNKPQVEKETASTALINGNDCLGQVAGYFGTKIAIQKARDNAVGIVTVKKSNHYGIAGYYSQMILAEDMLGISMTNSAPLVVPTFGREMIIGTNPISLTAPTRRNRPFFLDMATSVIPRGKLEVYSRKEKPIPEGWAVDASGKISTNPVEVLQNMTTRAGGGILPLGGEGETYSGYKGYGMAVLVDILCGILSGGAFADMVDSKKDGKPAPAEVGHFFMAIKIQSFVDLDTFKDHMDTLIDRLKSSRKALGENRIFIHGEKEYELYDRYIVEGVPLEDKVYDTLAAIARDLSVEFTI